MKLGWRAGLAFVASAFLCFPQSKELVQLNRELANIEDQMREMQKANDEKLEKILQLVQQALATAGKTETSVAGMETGLRQQVEELRKTSATVGVKVDEMASSYQALRESVETLNARFAKLEQQIVDIRAALTTLQSPLAPPAAETGSSMSADTLFQSAVRDKTAGNNDLALKGFKDYVQNFGTTYLAPAAEYYIGEIHFNRGDFGDAAAAFDLVLDKYSDNEKTPDAHYMKALALLKMKKVAEARGEFNTLVMRFPNHERAAQAREQLTTLKPAPKTSRSKK
jgi:TolA-binding protein